MLYILGTSIIGTSLQCVNAGMPLGLLKKVGKYLWTGGLGAEPPAGSRGSALVGVQGGFEARAFAQSELPRKPPIDTHGRYTYHTCTGGGGGEGEKKKNILKKGLKKKGGGKKGFKKKSDGLKKSEFRQKLEKRHPCHVRDSTMPCIHK